MAPPTNHKWMLPHTNAHTTAACSIFTCRNASHDAHRYIFHCVNLLFVCLLHLLYVSRSSRVFAFHHSHMILAMHHVYLLLRPPMAQGYYLEEYKCVCALSYMALVVCVCFRPALVIIMLPLVLLWLRVTKSLNAEATTHVCTHAPPCASLGLNILYLFKKCSFF